MKEMSAFELNDENLDQVAGGLFDDSWATGLAKLGDTCDLSQYVSGGCRRCSAYPLITTITGISGYSHQFRCKCVSCGREYYYYVDTNTVE